MLNGIVSVSEEVTVTRRGKREMVSEQRSRSDVQVCYMHGLWRIEMSLAAVDGWSAQWVAARIAAERSVSTVRVLSGSLLMVERATAAAVVVATVAEERLGIERMEAILGSDPVPNFLVNLADAPCVSEEAFRIARSRRMAIGTLLELRAALWQVDVSTCINEIVILVDWSQVREPVDTVQVEKPRDRIFVTEDESQPLLGVVSREDLGRVEKGVREQSAVAVSCCFRTPPFVVPDL